jgi:hypothetical protein
MFRQPFSLVSLVRPLAVALVWLPAVWAEDANRGVRLRQQPGNVTYDVELIRGTQRAIVPVSYEFKTGDRFALRVKVAAPSYVYVLNRTFVGSPEDLKSNRQIKLVPDKAAPAGGAEGAAPQGSPYSLVYPAKGASRILRPGVINIIPAPGQLMEMDENPGVEKLLVIVSPKPIDLSRYFDGASGQVRSTPAAAAAGKQDSPGDVLGKLNAELTTMAGNAEVAESSDRAISFVPISSPKPPAPSVNPGPSPGTPNPSGTAGPKPGPVAESKPVPKPGAGPVSTGAPVQPAKPYLIEITLAHYPAGA